MLAPLRRSLLALGGRPLRALRILFCQRCQFRNVMPQRDARHNAGSGKYRLRPAFRRLITD